MNDTVAVPTAAEGIVTSYRFRPVGVDGETDHPTVASPRIVSAADLHGRPIPPRRWIVADWVPWQVVTGLYGGGGEGKTLLLQQLQTSAALGSPWIGLPVEPFPSLGVFCEDELDELLRRQHDINTHYGCDFASLRALHLMPRFGEENLLMTFSSKGKGELTPFHKEVREAALDLKAKLLGIDTVSDTFGGNENDRSQVRQYVSVALGSLARDIKGAVIACAHPSRSGLKSGEGDSGSTAWEAAFRSRLFLTTPQPEEGDAPDATEAGFTMMGQPAASAAPALRVIMALGKFQGVTAVATPIGCRRVCSRLLGLWLGMVSP